MSDKEVDEAVVVYSSVFIFVLSLALLGIVNVALSVSGVGVTIPVFWVAGAIAVICGVLIGRYLKRNRERRGT